MQGGNLAGGGALYALPDRHPCTISMHKPN